MSALKRDPKRVEELLTFVHIYYLIGFRNRLVTLFQWAWTYFTYNRGVRLITTNHEYE
jgi:NADH dehydrogenase